MSALENRLSLTDLAVFTEVGVTAVSNWRKRHSDFPKARSAAGRELFVAGEVAQWLQARKIPRNSLKADEKPGQTYGDRFLRNLGSPSSVTATTAIRATTGPATKSGQRLWEAAGPLLDHYDAVSSAEFILGLLYLRLGEPKLWQQLRESPGGRASQDLLVRVELPPSPSGPRIPLFRISAHTPMYGRLLAELTHAIDSIDFGSSRGATSVAARLCDSLLAQIAREMGKRGGHFTPDSLAGCMIDLVDPHPHDLIYDPFCGSGELLAAAAAHVELNNGQPNDVLISGQARSESSWRMTKINLALHGVSSNARIDLSDALREDSFPDMQFDVVLANPPFNLRNWTPEDYDSQLWQYGIPPVGNANFAWLQRVTAKLAPGGRAAVLMPNGASTTRISSEAAIRARMMDSGVIECVVALPSHLFRSTQIPVSLWILRGNEEQIAPEILFIDATAMGVMDDRVQRVLTDKDIQRIQQELQAWRARQTVDGYTATTGFAISVTQEQIRATDYMLSPHHYVRSVVPDVRPERSLDQIKELGRELNGLRERSAQVRSMLESQLTNVTLEPMPKESPPPGWVITSLGKVCEVLAGPGTVDRSERQPSLTPLVLPRNIKQNRITNVDLDAVDPSTAIKLARYRLTPGDVVCTRTGTLGRYGLVQDEQRDWLLGPGCMRLRPREGVDPEYLTHYLNNPTAQRWLTDNATGSAIRQINTRTLNQMPLTLPPFSTQREIAEVLGAFDAEIAINAQISATTQALRDALLPLLMAGACRYV